SRTVNTPRGNNLLERVSDLINPATGRWDVQLVRDTFWADDACLILQIPLREGVHDFIAWQFDSKGAHSVKSAYKLYEVKRQKKNGGQGMSNHAPGNLDSCKDDSWKRIWKLPCPRNVQMFTWRVKHESLALLTNMHKRGLKVESTRCLFCGRADEDGAHLFIKCKAVKEGWRELALEGERIKL
uniref:Reverse transcriptase zinc-binding domain-containing protein n=1 Tax=Aegilops tauschii subsp. strangulata TaxID=200361 RepID=A0A452ZUW8_AEGTS